MINAHRRSLRPLLLLSALAGCGLLVAGCATNASADDEAEAQVMKEPPTNLMLGLPPGVEEEARGTGTLTYEAADHGQVYLYDLNANAVVGNFYMREGQRLIVSGADGRASLDGNAVSLSSKLSPSRTYIAYLSRANGSPQRQDRMQGSGSAGFRIVPDNGNNSSNGN